MKSIITLSIMILLTAVVTGQSMYKEIASFSETKCDSYFPLCFLKEGNHYNVLRNKDHWYWRHHQHDTEDIGKMLDDMITNVDDIISESSKKYQSQTTIVLIDQCKNIKMYLNYFYDKIDLKNKRRHRDI